MNEQDRIKRTGFDYIIRELGVITPGAHQRVRKISFYTDRQELESLLSEFSKKHDYFQANPQLVKKLREVLRDIRDITRTCELLTRGHTLDDIQLFEIKSFSLRFSDIRAMLSGSKLYDDLPDIEEVIRILDPEETRISSFYIYDAYSDELTELRASMRKLQRDVTEEARIENRHSLDELQKGAERLESQIRKELSRRLMLHAGEIGEAIEATICLDIDIAKSLQVERFGLNRPVFVEERAIEYLGLFNPELDQEMRCSGKRFQPVDVSLTTPVTVLTGANMSGKTVLLRTLALSQIMAQAGFYVPAESASIPVFRKIFFFSGDYEDIGKGLSSFAHEMSELAAVLRERCLNTPMLLLLDELARNTNPHEGTAIVNALVKYLSKMDVVAFISTHYDNIGDFDKTRFLRIRGLSGCSIEQVISADSLINSIDHRLVELPNPAASPREALLIARAVGVPDEVISGAEQYMKIVKGETEHDKQTES